MVLGLVDHDRGILAPASLEMLAFGRRLVRQLDAPLQAILIGLKTRPLAGRLAAHGVSTAHLVEDPRLDEYAPEAWARAVEAVLAATRPRVVLAPGSDRGQEVLAHVAARTGLPMAANTTEVRPGNPFLVTRLRWGGALLEEARLAGAVKLLTVAPQAATAEEVAPAGEIACNPVTPAFADTDFRVRIAGRTAPEKGAGSLAAARVVVGGGRGVGGPEGFGVLEELAGLLGGAVGASRVATNLGWRLHADQVGQTGARIAPDLYVACGISGAVQHMVGCKGAKHILAINTDREAPIVAKADFAVIGDLRAIVPALNAAIRGARSARPPEKPPR